MRSYIFILFLALSTGIAAQAPQTNAPAAAVKLLSKEDSVQYAMGIYFGQWILRSGFTTLDPAILMSGIYDVVLNKPRLINDSAAFPMIYSYRLDLYKDQSKKLEQDVFAMLKDKPGVQTLPGGSRYFVRRTGTGIIPGETDSIGFHFRGLLFDGSVFEDTYARKTPITTTLAILMPGLKEALRRMTEGSIWEIYIPAAMAYGTKGNGTTIPPDNGVIILLELQRVKKNG